MPPGVQGPRPPELELEEDELLEEELLLAEDELLAAELLLEEDELLLVEEEDELLEDELLLLAALLLLTELLPAAPLLEELLPVVLLLTELAVTALPPRPPLEELPAAGLPPAATELLVFAELPPPIPPACSSPLSQLARPSPQVITNSEREKVRTYASWSVAPSSRATTPATLWRGTRRPSAVLSRSYARVPIRLTETYFVFL